MAAVNKNEGQNEDEAEAAVSQDIPDYCCLATLSLCCLLPLGLLALLFYHKTVIYKEQNKYEKAKDASRYTFISALASIIGGSIIFLFMLYLKFLL